MTVQSALTDPQEALRLEILTQGGFALASLERATEGFEVIYAAINKLPGAYDLRKQIIYLRQEQAKLRGTLDQIAGLFQSGGPEQRATPSD